VATLPLILLPPSEGKAGGGDGPRWAAGSMAIDLDRERRAVARALKAAMHGSETSRRKLLDVSGAASLARATESNSKALTAPTMPAIERYAGVLYDALDHRSLSKPERRRLDATVVILSGLWGVVMPADPIPDYKLKMSGALPPMGKLSTWWREPLTERLLELAAKRPIWNLLPNQHAAAWAPPADREQWSVRFLDRKPDGSLASVSHENKSLKGALARYLVVNPTVTPADLRRWKHPSGYRYAASATETRNGVASIAMIRG
jgi:cytoplasmic iron level regulating protein YaaA (DUF328/UPF0246 family)